VLTVTLQLLMEAYVIEPVDVAALEEVFRTIVNNPNIELQGTHFATLINAYGCVCKDLDKAIATFDSIPTYPNGPAIEALTVEALINVFVHHRRTDLIPTYVAKMMSAGVHMTAYVANAMIRGYAVVGDMEQARAIFESLQDPPTGVAAPHNHAPHDLSSAPIVNPMEPVYREVRTCFLPGCSGVNNLLRSHQHGKRWSEQNLALVIATERLLC
jgi:pentatricopeptide repeat protein